MYGLIGAALCFASLTFWEVVNLRKRVDHRLSAPQRQLNKIATHLNVDMSEDLPIGVLELIQARRKIESIKLSRERTGASLAEAKESVERIQAGTGSLTDG